WLGRGNVTCANAAAAKQNTNRIAKMETELRLRELMGLSPRDGFDGMITYNTVDFHFNPVLSGGRVQCLAASRSCYFWFCASFPSTPQLKTDTAVKLACCELQPSAQLKSLSLTRTTSGLCHEAAAARDV